MERQKSKPKKGSLGSFINFVIQNLWNHVVSSSKYQSRIPVEVSLGHPGLDFYFVLVKSMAKIYNEFITFFYESWIYKTWIFILFCLFKMYFHLKIKIYYKMQKYTTEEDEQKIKFFKRDKNVLFLVHKTF